MNAQIKLLGLFVVAVISFSARANEDSIDQLSRHIFSYSGANTCISTGLIRFCGKEKTDKNNNLLQVFDHNSDLNKNKAINIISNKENLKASDFKILSSNENLSKNWNEKLKIIADYSYLSADSLMNMPEDMIEITNKLVDADIPPLLDIDLSEHKYSINEKVRINWIELFKSNPEFERYCTKNGEKIICSDFIQQADFIDFLEEIGKATTGIEVQADISIYLTYLHFEHELNESFSNEGRKVYSVESENFSPQVDFLGNLYLPKNFETLYSSSEQDLILSHEAAHVKNFSIDYLLAMTSTILKSSDIYSFMDKYKSKFIKTLRQPDEMLVDLLAASIFSMSEYNLKELSNLMHKIEPSIEERSLGLQELGELRAEKIMPSSILHNRLNNIGLNLTTSPEIKSSIVSNSERTKRLLFEYRNSLIKYLAYISPGIIVGISDDYDSIDLIKAKSLIEKDLYLNVCSVFGFTETTGNQINIKLCSLTIK